MKLTIFLLLAIVLLGSAFYNVSNHSETSEYSKTSVAYAESNGNVTTHEGDLVLSGTQTFLIENCTFIQTGNVIVKDFGKLVVKNCEFQINQTYPWEYWVVARNNATLEFTNMVLAGAYLYDFALAGNSSTFLTNTSSTITPQEMAPPCFLRVKQNSSVKISNSSLKASIQAFDQSRIAIENSLGLGLGPMETSHVRVVNSSLGGLDLWFAETNTIYARGLSGGFFQYLDLKDKFSGSTIPYDVTLNDTMIQALGIVANYDCETKISDSVVNGFGIYVSSGTSANIGNMTGNTFCENQQIGQILLNKTRIGSLAVHLEFAEHSLVSIANSTLQQLFLGVNTNIYVQDSTLEDVVTGGVSGTACFDKVIWRHSLFVYDDNFYLCGDITFLDHGFIGWRNSVITRDFNIVVKGINGEPLQGAELSTETEDNVQFWNGITNADGKANLNITFGDGNYTDPLRIEGTRLGFYNATKDFDFLSNTPVVIVLAEKLVGDLDENRQVNILDISIVAKAFKTKVGDENWNPVADLNRDDEINILDITLVAKDYGTVV